MVGRTIHIDLTAGEVKALEELSKTKDMSEVAVIRQALRLYQLHNHKISQGCELVWHIDGKPEEDPLKHMRGCGDLS